MIRTRALFLLSTSAFFVAQDDGIGYNQRKQMFAGRKRSRSCPIKWGWQYEYRLVRVF